MATSEVPPIDKENANIFPNENQDGSGYNKVILRWNNSLFLRINSKRKA